MTNGYQGEKNVLVWTEPVANFPLEDLLSMSTPFFAAPTFARIRTCLL